MYDGLDRVPVKNMNFKQLRERVQVLQDRYDALLRRLGGDYYYNGDGVDWANIVTPLIRAKINRLEITASLNSESLARIYARPDKNGFAPLEDGGAPEALDHALIYKYIDGAVTEYWYWDSNSWRASYNAFSSKLGQTPAGFQLDGTLELKTDNNSRMTVSDSFIKMYPEIGGCESYEPKLQIGYDADSSNNNPVIILGQGSGAKYPEGATDDEGNDIEGAFKTTSSMGCPVRYGQSVIYKTATGLVLGGADDGGFCRFLEIRVQNTKGQKGGIYYHYEEQAKDDEGNGLYDKNGDAVKKLCTYDLAIG